MTFAEWRVKARDFLEKNVYPDDSLWMDNQDGLFQPVLVHAPAGKHHVPKAFVNTAGAVACHADPKRWALLYRLLWRLTHGERHLLEVEIDPDVARFVRMHGEVRHDMHRLKAFLRFRKVEGPEGEEYIAWHKTDHDIIERMAPWFVARFGAMRWSILTPQRCAYWDTRELRFGPGVPRSAAPESDELEKLWRAYYSSIYNPARANEKLVTTHIPKRYWSTMPETELIPQLLADSHNRVVAMAAAAPRSAAEYIPPNASLTVLRQAVHQCRGCELYRCATQPVFGEGPEGAPLFIVGEQPGDMEDLEGKPFVGPAGQLLDRALAEAGLNRDEAFVTSALKHFKFEERGKRRIHKTAARTEVAACQPWLDAQISAVKPRLILAMGATAGLSILGRQVAVTKERGQMFKHPVAEAVLITTHPSFMLRIPDPDQQAREYAKYVEDLRMARDFLAQPRAAATIASAS